MQGRDDFIVTPIGAEQAAPGRLDGVALLKDYARVVAHIATQSNSSRGVSQATLAEERQYVSQILSWLLGREPTAEEIDAVTDW